MPSYSTSCFSIPRRAYQQRYGLYFLLAVLALAGLVPRAGVAQGVAIPGLPHFEWQNPKPTGHGLFAMAAPTDSVAYVGGIGGTLIKTTTAGRTWEPLNCGFRRNLDVVSFATAQAGWVAGTTAALDWRLWAGPGEVRRTTDGGRTWTRQLIGPRNHSVRICALQALSATEAYLLYDDAYVGPSGNQGPLIPRLRHTTNGGLTWPEVVLPPGSQFDQSLQFNASSVINSTLQFVSPLVGYLAAGNLSKTTDGGQTWANVSPDNRYVYTRCSFADAQHGWLESAGNNLVFTNNLSYTADGGQTWVNRPAGDGSGRITALAFADAQHGIVTMGVSELLRTTDAGLTWTYEAPPVGFLFPRTLALRPGGVGWRLASNCVERSAGAGQPWVLTTPSFTTKGFAQAPEFFDAVHGWATATYDTVLWRTHDRGAHWRSVSLRGAPLLNHQRARPQIINASFIDRDTGFVFVLDYSVLGQPRYSVVRTADGGVSWQTTFLPVPFNWYSSGSSLRFVTGRRGAFVGNDGLILMTQDGGQSWQRKVSGTTLRLDQVAWADSLTAFAVGDSLTFCKTLDGGVTWTNLPPIYRTASFLSLTMRSPLEGYCGSFGDFAHTNDGWQTFTGPLNLDSTSEDVSNLSVSFPSRHAGWLFAGSDYYRTRDSGQSWQRVTTVSGGRGGAPALGTAVDRFNAWAVGASGSILHYSEKFIQTDTDTAQPRAYCTGDVVTVAFDKEGLFSADEDSFLIELSNKMGRFRPRETTILPGIGRASASPLRATLPATLAAGTRYRVRVIRADSSVVGGDNERDLTIWPRPAAVAVAPADSTRICASDSVQLTAPAGFGQYQWTRDGAPTATTASVWVKTGGTYTVQVAQGGGCFGPAARPVTVRVTPRPAAPLLAQTTAGTVLLTATPALLPPATYQWTGPSGVVPGATGNTLLLTSAAQNGFYSVTLTQRGCASAASARVQVLIIGLAEDAADAAGLSVAPNPATDAITVRVSGRATGLRTLVLRDLAGRAVLTLAGEGRAAVVVEVAGVPTGTYLLDATLGDGRRVTRRLVVAR